MGRGDRERWDRLRREERGEDIWRERWDGLLREERGEDIWRERGE